MKKHLQVLGLGFLVVLAVVIGGCGGSTSTTTFYYYPDWTPDGKIICSKNIQTTSSGSGAFGGSGGTVSNNYSFTIMNVDGSNENDIKGISNAAHVSASPLGNYFAYAEIEQNNIKVIDSSGNILNTIDCGAWVDSLDWAPDESKLVFGIKTSATSEIYVVNRDGSGKTFLTSGENVAWRIGENIAFEYSSPSGAILSTIKNDGTSPSQLRIGFDAQFTEVGKILYSYGLEVRQIKTDGTDDQIVFSDFSRGNPKISFDKKKIAAIDASKGYGIFIINISGTGEVQIK